jgi:hypothetical protein
MVTLGTNTAMFYLFRRSEQKQATADGYEIKYDELYAFGVNITTMLAFLFQILSSVFRPNWFVYTIFAGTMYALARTVMDYYAFEI